VEPGGIGRKIRTYRQQRGITQMELADRIGVSYQQVQKYEGGRSRITLDRLALVARALGTPLGAFLPEESARTLAEPDGLHLGREEKRLVRLFTQIRSATLRRTVLRLVQHIVEQQQD
jgi:transcriptional regulator with XRE-family HTH domain